MLVKVVIKRGRACLGRAYHEEVREPDHTWTRGNTIINSWCLKHDVTKVAIARRLNSLPSANKVLLCQFG